jgi:hypothetical protein
VIRFLLPVGLTRAVDGTGRPPLCGSASHFALRKDGKVATTPGEIRAAGAAAWIAVTVQDVETGLAGDGEGCLSSFVPVCPPCADRFIKEGF